MPFKTETTSARSAWGQWASFSLSLGKLSGYKGRVPSLSPHNIERPKEEKDWANYAMDIKSGFDSWAKDHDEQSAKDVEKYLANHSTEELKTLMQERQIPFQDDPWAMAHFNAKMGEIHSGIAEGQFQQNIANGMYDTLTPEQLDAEHYKFMNEYIKGVKEQSYGFLDGDTENSKFREGFFNLSPKQRLTSIASQQKRQDKILTQKAQLAELGEINSYLDSENPTADGLLSLMKAQEMTGGYHKTPDEVYKQYSAVFKNLPTLGDKGVQLIEDLRHKKIEGLGGLTGEEFYTKEGLDTLKVKALNIQYGSNMLQRANFERDLQRLARNGDNVSKMALLRMLEAENKLSGGKETDKGRAIADALKLHTVLQAKGHAEAKADYDATVKMDGLGQWAKSYLNGDKVETYGAFTKRYKINERDTIGFWDQLVQGAFVSGDETSISKVLNAASLKGAPSNLVKSVGNHLSNLYNRELMPYVEAYIRGEGIPVAKDENGNELGSYSYKPLGSTVEVQANALPASMRVLMSTFRANPDAVKAILKGSNAKAYNDLCIIDTALREGKNPIKYLGDIKILDDKMTDQEKKVLNIKAKDITDATAKLGFGRNVQEFYPSPYANNILITKVKARTEELYQVNGGKRELAKCIDDAVTEITSQYINVGPVLIPKRDISQGFLALNSVAGVTTDNDKELSNRLSSFEKVLNETLATKGFKDSKSYSKSYYNEAERVIVVLDTDGYPRGVIPIDGLSKKADELYISGERERMTTNKEASHGTYTGD